jgi:hypothetical protein
MGWLLLGILLIHALLAQVLTNLRLELLAALTTLGYLGALLANAFVLFRLELISTLLALLKLVPAMTVKVFRVTASTIRGPT